MSTCCGSQLGIQTKGTPSAQDNFQSRLSWALWSCLGAGAPWIWCPWLLTHSTKQSWGTFLWRQVQETWDKANEFSDKQTYWGMHIFPYCAQVMFIFLSNISTPMHMEQSQHTQPPRSVFKDSPHYFEVGPKNSSSVRIEMRLYLPGKFCQLKPLTWALCSLIPESFLCSEISQKRGRAAVSQARL